MITETSIKIPPVKTGFEFLASSHFKIGKEPEWLSHRDPSAYKSSFQEDYQPQKREITTLADVPPPAIIMHKDDTINEKCSITREQFAPAPSQGKTISGKSLTEETSFKMDRDDRIDTFLTTHAHYYQPIAKLSDSKNNRRPLQPMASHICQGDKEKEAWPESDYKRNFYEKNITSREEIVNDTFVGPNTIPGDHRSHGCSGRFDTTSRREFLPHLGHRKKDILDSVQYPKTGIPSCIEKLPVNSTHQVSFKGKFPSISARFDRNKALSELQKTTFKNGDARFDKFRTTTNDCHKFNEPQEQRVLTQLDMGKSSFPEGDMDPARSAQRISTTVTRSNYMPPPNDYKNPHVDGSKLFNTSKVSFGNDKEPHYETTQEANFPKKNIKYEKVHSDVTHSSIPLNYYNNLVSNSSYRIDYLPTSGVKKLALNKVALDDLRESHIGDPVKGFREFSTTSSDTYSRKVAPTREKIDVGRLQKSSIPIGTLQCY